VTVEAWLVASLRPIAALTLVALVAAPLPRWLGLVTGASLGLFVASALPPPVLVVAGTIDGALVARELAVGAALGLVAVMPLVALGWSARLVEVAAGEPGARPIFLLVGAAVFVGIDGPALLAEAIARSYAAVPIAAAPADVVPAIAGLATAAVRLAVPFVVGAAVIEIAVGAVARAAASPRLVALLPWRRVAVIALVAAGLVLVAVGFADALRAAWLGAA
jgi:flagellar biosynthesis protein FliR